MAANVGGICEYFRGRRGEAKSGRNKKSIMDKIWANGSGIMVGSENNGNNGGSENEYERQGIEDVRWCATGCGGEK